MPSASSPKAIAFDPTPSSVRRVIIASLIFGHYGVIFGHYGDKLGRRAGAELITR